MENFPIFQKNHPEFSEYSADKHLNCVIFEEIQIFGVFISIDSVFNILLSKYPIFGIFPTKYRL